MQTEFLVNVKRPRCTKFRTRSDGPTQARDLNNEVLSRCNRSRRGVTKPEREWLIANITNPVRARFLVNMEGSIVTKSGTEVTGSRCAQLRADRARPSMTKSGKGAVSPSLERPSDNKAESRRVERRRNGEKSKVALPKANITNSIHAENCRGGELSTCVRSGTDSTASDIAAPTTDTSKAMRWSCCSDAKGSGCAKSNKKADNAKRTQLCVERVESKAAKSDRGSRSSKLALSLSGSLNPECASVFSDNKLSGPRKSATEGKAPGQNSPETGRTGSICINLCRRRGKPRRPESSGNAIASRQTPPGIDGATSDHA